MNVTVIGTGYLGATHAACLAELGFEVLGVDVDAAKVAALGQGRVPFYEPALEPLLRRHVTEGRLRFTTSAGEAADFGDVHFRGSSTTVFMLSKRTCSGTPPKASKLRRRHESTVSIRSSVTK